jgi:hypothetical protein
MLYWADAIFFKDPLRDAFGQSGKPSLNKRGLYALITSAILLEYYDLALEVASLCGNFGYLDALEIQNLSFVCHQLSARNFQARADSLAQVLEAMKNSPRNASRIFSSFIDERRFYADHREPSK